MSWQIGVLALVGLIVLAGLLWFERSRPSAKVIALVAALAALAALGRIAFAPVPNVKPTTDIVLLSGFALGGAPGFAIGSIAALVSNFFFGQGPWTPWQMAAWGGVGAAGAGIGVLARRFGWLRSRVGLAVICAIAGLAFGAVLDFSSWMLLGGAASLEQYLAILIASLPANLAHAAGNFVFALAFGPALLRTLERYKLRLSVSWQPAVVSSMLLLAVVSIQVPVV